MGEQRSRQPGAPKHWPDLCCAKRLDLDSPRDYPEEDRAVFRCACAHQDVVGRMRRVLERVLGRRKEGGSSRMSPGVSGIILPARRLLDRGLIRVLRTGRGPCLFWSGEGVASGPTATGAFSARSDRLILEMLMWLVGRDSEQGVMLRVCSKAFQHRLFGMTSSEVGARRALGAVGGAWRDSATMCYSGPGAGRSGGVLPGPVALRALEVASYRRSRGQGSGSTTHL